MQLIKAALCHAAHFVKSALSLLCSRYITVFTKLSGELFTVWHSPYPVRKFELGWHSEHGENGWEHFCNKQIYKRRQNSRFLLDLHLLHIPDRHDGYQCQWRS